MRRFVAVQKRQRRDDLQYSSVYISTSASRKMDDGNVAKSSMAASTSNDETNAMTASTNGSLKRKRLRDSFAATIDDTATT
jgi:hypothetical protein